jgi:hypothetical protein
VTVLDDDRPQRRWDPGARYRPSVLAGVRQDAPAAATAAPDRPRGRLVRGPARRTAVFDRSVWQVRGGPAGRGRAGEALASALECYRCGVLDTSGLVRAVGRALAP